MFRPRSTVNRRSWSGRPTATIKRGPKTFSFSPDMFVKKAITTTVEAYQSQHQFADFALHPAIQANIAARGYITPTPIQDQTISYILQGKDVVGLANTGTGKTAAFLLPLIHKVMNNPTAKILIVTPTRELAVQIQDELHAFSNRLNIKSSLIIGGASINVQVGSLRRNPHFVIGTPGRLKDHSDRGTLSFRAFGTVVLDEVDRMLDMGFVREIERMIKELPPERHSLFFSATLPPNVKVIMDRLLNNPITVSVKTGNTTDQVEQDVIKLAGRAKVDVLHDLLIQAEFEKVLVFGRTKWGMEKLAKELEFRGFNVAAIHGNKSQYQRQKALDMFKASHIQVLLATDIASRGLDIDNVTHVINFDLPESYEDYVHRIGRTGRANKTGMALTFID